MKILVVGGGGREHAIIKSLKKQNDLFEVVGYALPENEREKFPKQAEAFKGYREMTVEEILSDPEIQAVTVETEEIILLRNLVCCLPMLRFHSFQEFVIYSSFRCVWPQLHL